MSKIFEIDKRKKYDMQNFAPPPRGPPPSRLARFADLLHLKADYTKTTKSDFWSIFWSATLVEELSF